MLRGFASFGNTPSGSLKSVARYFSGPAVIDVPFREPFGGCVS